LGFEGHGIECGPNKAEVSAGIPYPLLSVLRWKENLQLLVSDLIEGVRCPRKKILGERVSFHMLEYRQKRDLCVKLLSPVPAFFSFQVLFNFHDL